MSTVQNPPAPLVDDGSELLLDSTDHFAKVTANLLQSLFGINDIQTHPGKIDSTLVAKKEVYISIFFTGVVYGEYLIGLSEETVKKINQAIGMDATQEIETQIAPIAEALNIIVGQAIDRLSKTYEKLTITSPRIHFGKMVYPRCKTGSAVLNTPHGDIECHFYYDRMQLDLAVSYQDAVDSLLSANKSLQQVNETLKQQQTQLVQSEKMASLGVMAAGIAHEINNPLAYVDSNVNTLEEYSKAIGNLLQVYEILLKSFESKDHSGFKNTFLNIRKIKAEENFGVILSDTQELLDETRFGVKRIKEIVTGLKRFSHLDEDVQSEADLNEEIENMLRLLWNQIKFKCTLKKDMRPLPKVECYPGQLNQVFVNIVMNAAQALPESGGTISISTQPLGEDQVEIIIADNGKGISPENLGRIFDPFFSTKPVGEGTGLGLSISFGIIEKHGGTLTVQSKLGEGAKFRITLPIRQKIER